VGVFYYFSFDFPLILHCALLLLIIIDFIRCIRIRIPPLPMCVPYANV